MPFWPKLPSFTLRFARFIAILFFISLLPFFARMSLVEAKNLIDYDGDTHSDLVFVRSCPDRKFVLNSLASLKRFNLMEIYNSKNTTLNYQNSRFLTGNFDSDFLTDYAIIYRYSKSATGIFTLCSSKKFKPERVFYSSTFSPDQSTFLAGHFDNDSLTDFVGIYNYGQSQIGVFLFLSKRGYQAKRVYLSPKGGWNFKRSRFLTGDFNGDGTDELCALYFYFNNSLGVFIFQPGSSYRPVKKYRSGPNLWDFNQVRFLVGDFYGNRSEEIVAFKKEKKVGVFLISQQKHYKPQLVAQTSLTSLFNNSSFTVSDFNFYGKDEIATCIKNKNGFNYFYLLNYPEFKPTFLKTAILSGALPALLSDFSEASPLSKNRFDFSPPKIRKITLKNLKTGDISLIVIKGARAFSGQKISIYGKDGQLIASAPCSTGRHFGTPLGNFRVIYKREVLISRNFLVYCIKPVYFKEGYAIHGWPRSRYTHQLVSYYLLGRPASHGCVRTTEEFATAVWKGSKVYQTKVKILP